MGLINNYRGLQNACSSGMRITCTVPNSGLLQTIPSMIGMKLTSSKRIMEDKELLFIAHKIATA